uniref:Uncharacterized protein n=2 Tax=Candidatus Kuenenia TaxID=380738 RepID=Q1PY95_KUEST|nr:unknown protein [Candidatus Kuenenia stuttgartiensis]
MCDEPRRTTNDNFQFQKTKVLRNFGFATEMVFMTLRWMGGKEMHSASHFS